MTIKSKQLGPGSLKFGEVASEREFATQLRKAELNPDVKDGDTLPVLSGEELTEDDEITWEVGGSILQDYDLDSLESWAFAHTGEWVPFTFTPNSTGTQSWQGEAKIRPIKVGGDVKTRNESDFTFPARNVGPVPTAGIAGMMGLAGMSGTIAASVEE